MKRHKVRAIIGILVLLIALILLTGGTDGLAAIGLFFLILVLVPVVLIGIIVGLLLSPKPREQTREKQQVKNRHVAAKDG